jgi:L,D-transpeptidase ErfK/SrfK
MKHRHSEGPGIDRRGFVLAAGAAALTAGMAAPALAARAPEGARGNDLIGRIQRYRARHEDTLLDLARQYNLGYTELVAANPGIDPWMPGAGVELLMPTRHILPQAPRKGLILNLADQRLYYLPAKGDIDSMPIGIGVEGWETPTGTTRIVRKRANPTWTVPKSIRAQQPDLPAVVPAGPDNPLGQFALYLGWPSYLIHGTNNPWGVGRRVSHGCVRLYPEDIARMFNEVPIGTPVTVVNQEVKTGWSEGTLYLEVHLSTAQADEMEDKGRFTPAMPSRLVPAVVDAASDAVKRIDWSMVRRAGLQRNGVPMPILKPKTA